MYRLSWGPSSSRLILSTTPPHLRSGCVCWCITRFKCLPPYVQTELAYAIVSGSKATRVNGQYSKPERHPARCLDPGVELIPPAFRSHLVQSMKLSCAERDN